MAGSADERRVFFPVDISKHSEDAFDWFANNMYKPSDKVILFHVTELVPSGNIESEEDFRKHVDEHETKVKKLEDKYTQKLKDTNVTGEIKMGGGKPGEAICKALKEENASMVVMGSRGVGTIRRTFLGSVSDYVLHHAHIPVIICPKH